MSTEAPMFVRRKTPRQRVERFAVLSVLIIAAAIYLFPLVAMIFTSLKSMPEIIGLAPFENSTIFSPPRI